MSSYTCLVCLIGIPGSGKTTFSQAISDYLENYKEIRFVVKIVCFDDYLETYSADSVNWKCKRKEIWNEVLKIVENSVKPPEPGDSVHTVIVLDDNMYYRSMRYEYVKLARLYNIGFCQIYLDAALDKALEFNCKRNNSVPDYIINQMFERIEKPCAEKYMWESRSITYTSYSELLYENLHCIRELISSSLNEPMKQIDDSTPLPKPSQSQVHLADLALRKVVAYKIKQFLKISVTKEKMLKISSNLSAEKQNLVGAIKSGLLLLPDEDNMKDKSENDKMKTYYNFFCSLLD